MGLRYDVMAFQRRLIYQLALERDMEPGRTVRAWSLAKADEERRARGWEYHWQEDPEEEGVDEVYLWSGEAGESELLGIIDGIRRTTADVRLAAALLTSEALTSERKG